MFCRVIVDEWKELKSFADKLAPYLFRGQSSDNIKWKLEPRLEREAKKYSITPVSRYYYERKILNEFQRGAQLHISKLPQMDDKIGWLSIMQHYGCPTRLLDFTESLYVAALFAVEQSHKKGSIWAINKFSLENQGYKLNEDPEIMKKTTDNYINHYDVFSSSTTKKYLNYEDDFYVKRHLEEAEKMPDNIIYIKPQYLTERSNIQKGIFLYSLNLEVPFDKTLFKNLISRHFDYSKERNTTKEIPLKEFKNIFRKNLPSIVEFILNRDTCIEAIFDLDSMNINSATLFPGLDGYARSLTLILRDEEKDKLIYKGYCKKN